MSTNPTKTYSPTIKTLHWLVVVLVILALGLGLITAKFEPGMSKLILLRTHLAIGITIAALMLIRVIFAFRDPRPQPKPNWPLWMRWSSKGTHVLLYALPFILAATGLGMMAFTPLGAMAISGDISTWPDLSNAPPHTGHFVTSRIFLAAIILHFAAALYHHYWRRDDLFSRLWPIKTKS